MEAFKENISAAEVVSTCANQKDDSDTGEIFSDESEEIVNKFASPIGLRVVPTRALMPGRNYEANIEKSNIKPEESSPIRQIDLSVNVQSLSSTSQTLDERELLQLIAEAAVQLAESIGESEEMEIENEAELIEDRVDLMVNQVEQLEREVAELHKEMEKFQESEVIDFSETIDDFEASPRKRPHSLDLKASPRKRPRSPDFSPQMIICHSQFGGFKPIFLEVCAEHENLGHDTCDC